MSAGLDFGLPKGWSWSPLKFTTSLLSRGIAPDYEDNGTLRAISQAANQSTGLDWTRTRFGAYEGDPRRLKGYLLNCDVLINSTGNGTLGRVGYFTEGPDDIPCVADGHITIARADPQVADPRFMYYWLGSTPFYNYIYSALVVGATNQIELNREGLAGAPIALPPLDEQRRIADFLDVEIARIDGLRAKRLAQMSVLDELELARIWKYLGTAEANGPVYAYFDVRLGKMLNAERSSGDHQQPYLRHANVHWYEIATDDMATMTFEPDEWQRYSLRPGDLLVNEGGAGGTAEAAVWDGRITPCFYQKSLHRVRARGPVPVEWLMYWLRYAKALGVFDAEADKATIPHLTGEKLAELRIPIPDDGHKCVSVLAAEITAIRETQRKMEAANAVLAERRQALITAAVTGGITV